MVNLEELQDGDTIGVAFSPYSLPLLAGLIEELTQLCQFIGLSEYDLQSYVRAGVWPDDCPRRFRFLPTTEFDSEIFEGLFGDLCERLAIIPLVPRSQERILLVGYNGHSVNRKTAYYRHIQGLVGGRVDCRQLDAAKLEALALSEESLEWWRIYGAVNTHRPPGFAGLKELIDYSLRLCEAGYTKDPDSGLFWASPWDIQPVSEETKHRLSGFQQKRGKRSLHAS